VGGITYTVKNGETGYLVPPRDPDALAERIAFMLKRPELLRRIGRAARWRVEREFTWPTVAERTASLYERVLAAGASAHAAHTATTTTTTTTTSALAEV
jgi:D-inositol-3-phosphate glycosyltransferase